MFECGREVQVRGSRRRLKWDALRAGRSGEGQDGST